MLIEISAFTAVLELIIVVFTVAACTLYFSLRHFIRAQDLNTGFRIILLGLLTLAGFSCIDVYAYIAFPRFLTNNLNWFIHDLHNQEWFVYLLPLSGLFCAIGLLTLLNVYSVRSKKHTQGILDKNIKSTLEKLREELSKTNPKIPEILKDPSLLELAYLLGEKNFRTLFYESPGIFLSINKDNTIRDINLYAKKRLQISSGDVIGQALANFMSREDLTIFENFIESGIANTLTSETCEIKLNIRSKPTWVRISCRLMVEADKEEYLLLICQDVSDSKEMEKTISTNATHDNLTGLHNRHALENYLNEIFNEQSLFTEPAALIYFDVDQFKIVNDTCGHVAGDELLKQFVAVITEHCKKLDFFARISGDEFAIVKKNVNPEQAVELAETVRSTAEDVTFSWDAHSFRQSVSVGVALTSPRVCTLTDIFGAADAACAQAKETGRNRVILHKETRDAGQDSRNDMLWVSRIQQAFSSDRLELYFQPIVDLKNPLNGYIHYELLIRYKGDDGRQVSPDRFLPAAEKYGISNQIDLWVLTTALDFLQRHPEHTRELHCCSINLSANSLGNFQVRSAVKALMENLEFPTNKICFEITESSAIQSLNDAMGFIDEMKTLGCKFALDDFGTGFSSLGYLKNLDVDYLKIDGAFIRDIVSDNIDRAMVTAIASIGREMEIKTIAEYVEDEQVLKTLIPLNVDLGQGYGLARPMNLEEAVEYYKHGAVSPVSSF